ncbi:glycosyl hydrolase family 81 [Apiospora rasikravindrae]|uniref:glucan endo-1,3-beta-D-glucosidase n=1 Tax=Apiospora rasikravindrae TaxID=990691 RepID=A0ABR1TDB8_9PEZI
MWLFTLLMLLQINFSRSAPLDSPTNHPAEETSTGLIKPGVFQEGYLPLTVIANPYREGYQPVSVITSLTPSGTVQILPPAVSLTPDTTGKVIAALETEGRPSIAPFPTGRIPEPTALLVPFGPALQASSTPVMEEAAASSDIFRHPIATHAPSTSFETRKDHPVPRLGVVGNGPHQTNKFYANFFLGNQNAPTYLHPYSVAWARGQGATSSWGLSVSHIEASQRVYGQTSPDTGAAKYFLNPVGIQSLCLSAFELSSSSALTVDTTESQSVNVNLLEKAGGKPLVTFPLVQGMAFVTAIYHGGTPAISSGVFFKTITKSTKGPKQGVTKYTIYLEDGKVWHVYAYSEKGDSFDLQVINNAHAKAAKPYNGIIQIIKDPGNAESLIDAASGTYPTGVTLSGTSSGNKGTYTFKYKKAGVFNGRLMMYALPHHIESFDTETHNAVTKIQLQTTTKGMATAVIADSWTMVEPNMPVSMGFAPWDPVTGSKPTVKPHLVNTILPMALKEISQDVNQQTNQNSMYFGGKALTKFALLCYAVHDMLQNQKLAQTGLSNLKAAFGRFVANKQQFPLYYESAWGGIVSSATYLTGNSGADFGNTYYNDHHFHYGYFILAAAIIGKLDPTWLTKANVDYVNTLVRDVANPSSADRYFPVHRNFDWYHGHSWAHGLYETLDGKDQESSSEDAMHAYAIKMWGHTIKDGNMEARGNLMLSIITRSLSQYYLYTSDNKVQPSNFIGNRVAGILFENKCDHTTYFGANIEYIQGIHMIPLLPSSKLTRAPKFVQQEWETYFDKGRADKVEGGWRGILYGNLATVDPKSAWAFFTAKNFDPSWLDGGASLTWYQAYAAGKLSCSERAFIAHWD